MPAQITVRPSFDLTGRVALVTGANAGIGQAIAVALAGAGADVACAGRSRATETVDAIRELGRRVLDIEADLSSIRPIPRVIEQIIDGLGGLDILVNNAGIIRRADSLQLSEADWDEVLDTNLKSAFFLAQAAARHMIARGGGKIINIASMLSFQGGIRVASYTASKSAIAGVTRLLASEWAPHGINVNAIAPGYIATRNTAALQSDAVRNRQILDRIPAGRWGAPQDLTGAAVFLASAASDYVHGHILAVDGGWLAR
jgi:2-dehydro-3-deoxy-D-gluconate 5-dehydrogenase